MCDGYLSQIKFLVENLSTVIDDLESKVIQGCNDEAQIQPRIDQVQKAMGKYQQGMKSIRAAFEP